MNSMGLKKKKIPDVQRSHSLITPSQKALTPLCRADTTSTSLRACVPHLPRALRAETGVCLHVSRPVCDFAKSSFENRESISGCGGPYRCMHNERDTHRWLNISKG